jgi:hypothetical protein
MKHLHYMQGCQLNSLILSHGQVSLCVGLLPSIWFLVIMTSEWEELSFLYADCSLLLAVVRNNTAVALVTIPAQATSVIAKSRSAQTSWRIEARLLFQVFEDGC